jgi:hypothetical protein
MEEHRKIQPCSGCHKMMDPIGLSLENFDAIGRWRVNDGQQRVDPVAEMYDGAKLDGPVSLRKAVLNHSDAFVGNFTEQLLAYSLGRLLDYHDMPTVRSITRQAARTGNHFSAFVLATVKSAPFEMRTLNPASEEQNKAAKAVRN